jgi:hypothetical protein
MSKLSHSNPDFEGVAAKCEACGAVFDSATPICEAVFGVSQRVLCPTHAQGAMDVFVSAMRGAITEAMRRAGDA